MVIKSMTGFGRSHLQKAGVQVTVEVLSVNRKHLDINIVLPKHLNRFDPDIRKQIARCILRGHVTVRISVIFNEDAPLSVQANVAMAKQYFQGWSDIADALGLDTGSFSLSLLEKETDLFVYKETERMGGFFDLLAQGVAEALEPFSAMREREGKLLGEDISARLEGLKMELDQIALKAPEAVEKYRNKLIERIKTFLPLTETTDERLLREIALFAEKVDICEEVVRFNSHIEQFKELLKRGPPAAGKTAEFLVQELGRETNTIGSKCSDLSITQAVVKIKAELERIREQIQNIE